MTNIKNINVNKQIIFEKGNFLLSNSTFFYNNLKEFDEDLKRILLNPAPLKQCHEFQELIEEINKSKIKNNSQLNYRYSLEILFHIVNIIRLRTTSIEQIELIRTYIKYISSQFSEIERTIYNTKQNIIHIDKEHYEGIEKSMKQYKR